MHYSKVQFIGLVFIIISTVSPTLLSSQISARDNYNFLDFQRKRIYFGFGMDTNAAGFRINKSTFFIGNEEFTIVEGKQKLGVNLHFITNLKFGQFFDLRFTPGFSYNNRSFIFNNKSQNRIESTFIDVPFAIRYKSLPYKDKRVYVSGGMKYQYDLSNQSTARKSETLIKISPHDFQWEVGVGMQFFYPYFIFSPEIKYSRGLGNILIYNGSLDEARLLENVVSQTFTLSFNFEG